MPSSAVMRNAYQNRFGTETPGELAICNRCGLRWLNHFGARCSNESEEDYQLFLKTCEVDHSKVKIMLGADPEFEVRNKENEFVSADDIISDSDYRNKFGTDGNSSTGEIRTDPGSPDVVIKSISDTLDYANHRIKNYNLFAGAGKDEALGGHVHFSGISVDGRLLETLDHLISIPLHSISNQRFRSRHGYGRLSSYRDQPHGWEYRSPCSWISHPKIAQGVLEVAYVAAEAFKESHITFASVSSFLSFVHDKYPEKEKIISDFYKIIDVMVKKGRKLENIEIFQAWKKRNHSTEKVVIRAIKFSYSNDFNLDVIKTKMDCKRQYKIQNFEKEDDIIKVIGIRSDRTSFDVIYVSSDIRDLFPRHKLYNCYIKTWYDNGHTIGLSYSLRNKIEVCEKVLSFVKWRASHISRQNNLEDSGKIIEEIEACVA